MSAVIWRVAIASSLTLICLEYARVSSSQCTFRSGSMTATAKDPARASEPRHGRAGTRSEGAVLRCSRVGGTKKCRPPRLLPSYERAEEAIEIAQISDAISIT